MAGIARVGDIVGKGGVLVGPFSPDVTVNGRPVALTGCVFTAHPPCGPKAPQHCFGVVIGIPEGVTVNGIPPLVKGSIATCEDTVITASDDVFIVGGLLGSIISAGFGLVSGGGGSLSGLEKIGYSAVGSILGGQDPTKVLTSAAIGAAVNTGTSEILGEIKKVIR